MDFNGKNNHPTKSVRLPSSGQFFLLNFIMSNYLGPDVFSDNPKRSAYQRLAGGLPPYTSKDLGTSFISISQLESLYCYVLRNADPRLILEPNMLHLYLKGNMPLPSSVLLEDCRQFTSFFPMNIHGQRRYSGSSEIVKGIILIDDPVTSYMKEKDVERFKYLSGMNDLKIDIFKSLSYQHGFPKGKDDEPVCMEKSDKRVSLSAYISNETGNASSGFQEKNKRRYNYDSSLPASTLPSVMPLLKDHSEEGAFKTCQRNNRPVKVSFLPVPDLGECNLDASINLTGTAKEGITGPPVGVVDIGISKTAYFFRVAMPGVQRNCCDFSCEIESNGRVHLQGTTAGGRSRTIKRHSRVFHLKLQKLCPAGQFSLSFCLPGRVDPRLFSPNLRSDGIFEAVVIKHE